MVVVEQERSMEGVWDAIIGLITLANADQQQMMARACFAATRQLGNTDHSLRTILLALDALDINHELVTAKVLQPPLSGLVWVCVRVIVLQALAGNSRRHWHRRCGNGSCLLAVCCQGRRFVIGVVFLSGFSSVVFSSEDLGSLHVRSTEDMLSK
jgi:hypothetical protein